MSDMKELNLAVGQKVWSIQLGECEVESINHNKDKPYVLKNGKERRVYWHSYKHSTRDAFRSVFESNPFETKLVQENKDGWVDMKESKADLINALLGVIFSDLKESYKDIAVDKLQKLLESI